MSNKENIDRNRPLFELENFERRIPVRTKMNKLLNLNINNPGRINDNLLKIVSNPDLSWNSYQMIKNNYKAITKKIVVKNADSFIWKKMLNIETQIKEGKYIWKNIKRTATFKLKSKKKKSLIVLDFYDRILQENIRMVLNIIYEPIFQQFELNHSSRPKHSCLTALDKIKNNLQGMTNVIQGSFKDAYNNLNHKKLMNILKENIKDNGFLKLIEKFLCIKIEENKIIKECKGIPQGAITSPTLLNIYLHKFDLAVIKILKELFDQKNKEENRIDRSKTKAYKKLELKINILKKVVGNNKKRFKITKNWEKFKKHKKELIRLTNKRLLIESIPKNKQILKFTYCRYEDDWIILTNADTKTCEQLKILIKEWGNAELELIFNEDKDLITNLKEKPAKFLGFTIYDKYTKKIIRYNKIRKLKRKINVGLKIGIDYERVLKSLKNEGIIDDKYYPVHVSKYQTLKPWQIINVYSQKMYEFVNYYYKNITNKSAINYIYYLLKYSCLKTLASREKLTIRKIYIKYPDLKIKYSEIDCKKEEVAKVKETKLPTWEELVKWIRLVYREELIIKKNKNKVRSKLEDLEMGNKSIKASMNIKFPKI